MKFELGQWYKNGSSICQLTEVIQHLSGLDTYKFTYSDKSYHMVDEFGNLRGSCGIYFNFVHLPYCTGYDWEPVDPGEGYRILDKNELKQIGDEVNLISRPNKEWEKITCPTECGLQKEGYVYRRRTWAEYVPYTFDTCPAIIKVIEKSTKKKYTAYSHSETGINIGFSFYTFGKFMEDFTDINGGPLGTKK